MGILKYSFLLFATLGLMNGCSSMLMQKAPAPIQYQLSYEPSQVNCTAKFDRAVRVWDFSAISPYDQSQMVVEKSDGKSIYSNRYQWVSSPGNMVAQLLRRDISLGKLFPQTLGSGSPGQAPLDLTGQVFQFVWHRGKTSSYADLQVQVSVSSSGSTHQVLFRKTYKFTSPSSSEGTSAAFAGAMSKLMGKFSHELREDLCAVAEDRQKESVSQSPQKGP